MNLINRLFILSLLMLPAIANADAFVNCKNCSVNARSSAAVAWGMQNLKKGPSNTETVHVVDFGLMQISSFGIGWTYIALPPNGPGPQGAWVVYTTPADTPAQLRAPLIRLESSLKTLRTSVEASTIPKEVIAEAWDYVNCGYCSNNIESYLINTFSGDVETVLQLTEALANAFSLIDTSDISNVYRMQLEAGGYIEVEVTILGNVHLKIDVKKVVDPDNNTVPSDSGELVNYRIYVSNLLRNGKINSAINPLMLKIPTTATGVVIIIECNNTGTGGPCVD